MGYQIKSRCLQPNMSNFGYTWQIYMFVTNPGEKPNGENPNRKKNPNIFEHFAKTQTSCTLDRRKPQHLKKIFFLFYFLNTLFIYLIIYFKTLFCWVCSNNKQHIYTISYWGWIYLLLQLRKLCTVWFPSTDQSQLGVRQSSVWLQFNG